MPQSFTCPNCSAPLDVDGDGSATLRCPYCRTSVIVPQEARVIGPLSLSSSLRDNTYNNRPDVDLTETLNSIREKAVAGQEIEAIRLLRSTFVIGLSEAKSMVEAMQRGEDVDLRDFKLVSSLKATTLDTTEIREVMDFINNGKKIEAIRLFREMTGANLNDAKDAVDGMELSLSARPEEGDLGAMPGVSSSHDIQNMMARKGKSNGGRNCLMTGFIILIILTTVIPILAAMTSQGGPLAGVWARVNPFAIGKVTLEFGQEGTGPGYFTDARYVAVDNNGHIFVGEFNGGRVQVFDENGNYLTQWKATGEETGDIYLTGMAADRKGVVYTVVGSMLYVYDGLTGTLLGRMDHPDGWGFDDVTAAPDGSIVASWYKNRDDIIRFNPNGKNTLLLENAISSITNDSEMEMRMAVDGTGNIYSLAYFNEGVFVFSDDGKYISRFGSMGDAEGQFTSPRSIAADNLGRIYVTDFPGVMIYASDGRYLDTLPVNGAAMGITFDDQNNLYVVADEKVLRYSLK
jgi:ribosomal protein L7/L12